MSNKMAESWPIGFDLVFLFFLCSCDYIFLDKIFRQVYKSASEWRLIILKTTIVPVLFSLHY